MDRTQVTAEIAAARSAGDIAALSDIIERLGQCGEPWAGALRIGAVQARLQVKQGVQAQPAHWLDRYGLPRPDRRPLYRYHLSDAAFERAGVDLKSRAARFNADMATQHDAALFVLWSSAWFRRCYDGGMQRWADVARRLGLQPEQSRLRRWTDDGLRYWGQPPLKVNRTHHRLAAIARQGGFPVAAIREGAGGWAATFLQKLVSRLLDLSEPNTDVAEALAEDLEGGVPEIWRCPEIRAVSAELALAIVELRREAESAGMTESGLVSAWLDQNNPDWRRNLPLTLDEGGARQLIDGLIRVERLKGGHGSVRVRRFMVRGADGLRQQVGLDLDGDLVSTEPGQGFDALARDWSRLRLFAAGDAARHIAGELAVVEPGEDGRWRCMRSRAHARFDLPDNVPLMVELRGEGVRVAGPFLLPGGDAIRSDLRVCVGDPAAPGDLPSDLEIVGQASGGYRGEPVYVDVPADWRSTPHGEDGACREAGNLADRRQWEVCGAALFESPRGDAFLVRGGQKGDQRDSILLTGETPGRCESLDGLPIYCGTPLVRFRQGQRVFSPSADEIGWRSRGQREWASRPRDDQPGVWEVAWRDAATRHIRARTELIVAPRAFAITSARAGDSLTVEVRGWPGSVTALQGTAVGDAAWRLRADTLTQSHFDLCLEAPGTQPVKLRTPLRYQAWIFDWSGAQLARDSRISISSLKRYVARAPGRCELWAELIGPNRQPVQQASACWRFDEELPLSLVADELAALLRGSSQIDGQVRLDFNDGRPNHWIVAEFGHELRDEGRGLTPIPAVLDEARLVGRSMGSPHIERDLAPYGLTEQVNPRPINIDIGDGPWLVYLRANERVLSRPRIILGDELNRIPQNPLGRVMVNGTPDRRSALAALIDTSLAAPSAPTSLDVFRSIIDLAVSLDGLPPATFDVLKLIEERPALGPLLLFGAAPAQIEPLLRLSEGLRTAWCLIPTACWQAAWQTWGEHFRDAFPQSPGDVAQLMSARRDALIAHDPVLAAHWGLNPTTDALPLVANAFLNRSSDRIRATIANPFRPRLQSVLPQWSFDPGYSRVLDAPIVAALVSSGHITEPLPDPEIFAIKDIARSHPRYFQAAFAAQLRAR
ncbi:MAG: STY4851/ECs_5259 family protein [Brevundimonas sp.]|nr:STY4851/ECs_5259 family protein [Brevundimonas sp.]